MSIVLVSLFAAGLFALIGIGASRAKRRTAEQLDRDGLLCLGTVVSYGGDDLASVEFIPAGSSQPIRSLGLGPFQKARFPLGAKVAVLYSANCPALNRVVPERTDELKLTELAHNLSSHAFTTSNGGTSLTGQSTIR